jgi:hypothetical protein
MLDASASGAALQDVLVAVGLCKSNWSSMGSLYTSKVPTFPPSLCENICDRNKDGKGEWGRTFKRGSYKAPNMFFMPEISDCSSRKEQTSHSKPASLMARPGANL